MDPMGYNKGRPKPTGTLTEEPRAGPSGVCFTRRIDLDPPSPDEPSIVFSVQADVHYQGTGVADQSFPSISKRGAKVGSNIKSITNELKLEKEQRVPPEEFNVELRSLSVSVTSLQKIKSKHCCTRLYTSCEPLIWLISITLVCSYIMPTISVYDRDHENISPEITFNLERVHCIETENETMTDCLLQNETEYLTQDTIRSCRTALINIFLNNVCSMAKVKRSRPFPLLKKEKDLNHERPFPILKGEYFLSNWNRSITANESVALKYTTCIRTFAKNPFGDVKVIAVKESSKSWAQYDFIYKNYNLMWQCGFISRDLSTFEWYFQDPKNWNKILELSSVLSFIIAAFCKIVRFVYCNEQCRKSNPNSELQSPSNNSTKWVLRNDLEKKRLCMSWIQFQRCLKLISDVKNCGRSNNESPSSKRRQRTTSRYNEEETTV